MIARPLPLVVLLLLTSSPARGVTIGYIETFATDANGWRDRLNGSPAAWVAAGGHADNGGFVTQPFNFVNSPGGPADQGAVLFRGGVGASGGAFVGNWTAEDVTLVTARVRHDAPVPVNFFARFSDPANFPGAVAVQFAPIVSIPGPAGWQQLTFLIDPTNPQFVSFEGQSFATVFDSIGNVQIGVSTPAALAGVDATYHFSLDSVSIVPEPGSALLTALGIGVALLVRSARARVHPDRD